jgi:hypothetical protein
LRRSIYVELCGEDLIYDISTLCVASQRRSTRCHVESRVIALEELLEQADRHNKLLRDVYLVECAKRKERHPESANPPILKGIPLFPAAGPHKRMCESISPTLSTSPHDVGNQWQGSSG